MISIDPITRAEYDALLTAAERAQAVLAALTAPVTVSIYDETNTVRASGTMASPWATRNGDSLTIGELTQFRILDGGTPAPGWYLRFEGGSRWVRGTFGLSGADFNWSLAGFVTGYMANIGSVSILAIGGPVQFGWIDESEVKSLNLVTSGAGYNTTPDAVLPAGVTPTFAIVPAVTGMAINSSLGVLTSSIDRTATSVTVEIWDGVAEGALAGTATAGATASGNLSVGGAGSNPLAGAAVGRATATGDLTGGGVIGITSATAVVAIDTQAKPAVLGTVTFTDYNNTVVKRVNDCAASALALPTTLTALVPEYSQLPAFNSTGDMLMLNRIKPGDEDGYLFCDAASPFTVRNAKHSKSQWWPAFVTNVRWSPDPAEPYVLYAIGNDCIGLTWTGGLPTAHNNAVIVKLTINPTTGVITPLVVASFNHFRRLGAASGWADAREDLTLDANGHIWMACVGQRVADLEPFYVLHNITTNTTYAGTSANNSDPWRQLNANTAIGMSNVNRTPDSVYPVPDGTGFMAYNGEGLWKWNRTCTTGRNCINPGKADHGDIAFDSSGAAWWVCAGSNAGIIIAGKIDGDTYEFRQLLDYDFVQGSHFSGRNTLAKSKGCVVVSFDEERVEPTTYKFVQEVVLLYLDSTLAVPHVRRLCQHRADLVYWTGDSWTNDYSRGQSHATINRQGTKIVFGSNWGDQSRTIADTFLIENVP